MNWLVLLPFARGINVDVSVCVCVWHECPCICERADFIDIPVHNICVCHTI